MRFPADYFSGLGTALDTFGKAKPRDPVVSTVKWNPEAFMPAIAKDHSHDLDQIITDANEGRVGKDATHLKLRDHFERHHFDMKDVDSKGVPKGVESQMQKWFTHAPMGKRAALAVKNALPDTLSEKEAALKAHVNHDDLGEAHARQRRLGGGENDGRHESATKAVGPTTTMSSVCIDELNRMSHALVEKAKRDKINLSFEKAFTAIVTLTEKGRALAALEKFNRIQV